MALAHGGDTGSKDRKAVVDPLPAELAGLRVEIHETLSTQLVIGNPTAKDLEFLDENGQPFLRLGPEGAFANLSAAAWYFTSTPSDAVPVPQAVLDAEVAGEPLEPRWRRISREPSWGWFDRRVAVDEVLDEDASDGEAKASERHDHWHIPVRIGGRLSRISGRFVADDPAEGVFQARLTSPAEMAPGIRVTILRGGAPGLFLRNDSDAAITVLGAEGEPFLRVGPAGVEANLASSTWAGTGKTPQLDGVTKDEEPLWQRVSTMARFGWIEPRASGGPRPETPSSPQPEPREWQVSVRLASGETAKITGVTSWKARPKAPSTD